MTDSRAALAPLLLSLLCSGCGETEDVVTASLCIYGGATEPSQVPLEAGERRSVVAVYDPVLNGLCSAVVVQRGALLTAKHCLSPGRTSFADVQLLFGSDAYSSPLVRHPTAVALHSSADAALLRFDTDPDGDSWQSTPVTLFAGTIDESLVGTVVEIAGFGRTEESEGHLMFARQRVVAVDPATIAVGTDSNTGACFGDSGGPMLIGTTMGAAVLGILAWGPDHCRGGDHYVRADLLHDLAGGECEQ